MSTDSAPLVSVIIAAFNAAAHIAETCRSALAQTYRSIELIVVDDGSTDETAAIVQHIGETDSRVRLLRQENQGAAAARNAAIAVASGEFIAPLDADDVWDVRKIEQQVRRMQESGAETGLVYCWWTSIDIKGNILDRSPRWNIEGRVLQQLMEVNFTGNASVPLFRRAALEELGGYDTSLRQRSCEGCEDWDLALRVAEHHRVAVVSAVLVGYRRHLVSMSTACDTMWRSQTEVIGAIAARQPTIPEPVLQRASGQFALYLAGVSFWSGNYLQAFRWGFRARPFTLMLAVAPHVIRLLAGQLIALWSGRRAVTLRNGRFEESDLPEPLIPYAGIYRKHWQAFDPATGRLMPVHRTIIGSLAVQLAAVCGALLLVAIPHWSNDGLWFQGDAPRHAANGLFFWDLLTSLPTDPIQYALAYYARYPVITPGAYPPLFYIVEGVAFGTLGPSPYVAKTLVLASLGIVGVYTTLWGRRWIATWAGWAGACAMLLPGFALYSNAVLLNVPSTAVAIAALYHLNRWLDDSSVVQRNLFIALAMAAALTYYSAAIVLPIAYAWMLTFRAHRSRVMWILLTLLVAIVALLAWTVPAHFARNVPSLARIFMATPWRFYAQALPEAIGTVWLAGCVLGTVAACVTGKNRVAAVRLLMALLGISAELLLLPAMDPRYALLLGPIAVLGTFLGILTYGSILGRAGAVTKGVVLLVVLGIGARQAVTTPVPQVSGIDRVAEFLKVNAATDSVLFSGQHDGVFGFYVRALDPTFSRRFAVSNKLLYHYVQDVRFFWHETPIVSTTQEVVERIRTHCGCQWVAVEVEPESWLNATERLLREALKPPSFELAASFPVMAHPVRRIDLYRLRDPVSPAPTMDLRFPSFSERVFRDISPIERRR